MGVKFNLLLFETLGFKSNKLNPEVCKGNKLKPQYIKPKHKGGPLKWAEIKLATI